MEKSHSPATQSAHERNVTIHASFGSDIQCDVSMRVLDEFLEAWQKNVESAHKRNKVTISRSGDGNTGVDPDVARA